MRTIRVFTIACVAMAGCKGSEPTKVDTTKVDTAKTAPALDLPSVDDDRAIVDVAKVRQPAAVVWIDAKGGFEVAEVHEKWTGTFPTGKRTPAADLKSARAAVYANNTEHGPNADDPPPPPPEDTNDYSGGTGTAMALDEGKMGKTDAERAEGQYKMKHADDDPQLARQQAIDEARKLAGNGPHPSTAPGADPGLPSLPVAALQTGDAIVVAATPTAPAKQLVRLIDDMSGAIAVSNHGKLAVLSHGYGVEPGLPLGDEAHAWIELHITADGVHVVDASKRDSTAIAWKQGGVDRDALRASYNKLVAERFAGAAPVVEVLVGDGSTAQQLVDVLVTLDGLAPAYTSLGPLGGTSDARLAKLADLAKPHVSIGRPVANGDLDKALIRSSVQANTDKILACYDKALTAKPAIHGTVLVQFYISPSGAVRTSEASGLDPDVAMCVASVIKAIVFAKPKGGGGVQVNFPFSFRPGL